MFRYIVKILILTAVVAVPGYYFRTEYSAAWNNFSAAYRYRPCAEPIYYRIGEFDDRFAIGRDEFLRAIAEAAAVWEESSGRALFRHDPFAGPLLISLVYDYRQDTTRQLSLLDEVIEADKAEFERLKTEYDRRLAEYRMKMSELQNLVEIYNRQATEHQREVRRYNQRGGAPPGIYEELTAKQAELNRELSDIRARQAAVDALAGEVNRLAAALNELIANHNLQVEEYNMIGDIIPPEYEQGNFISGPDYSAVTIYQFSDYDKLVRVLAHELGHALGLGHLDDPENIMHELNIGENRAASAADRAALEAVCAAPFGLSKAWLDFREFAASRLDRLRIKAKTLIFS